MNMDMDMDIVVTENSALVFHINVAAGAGDVGSMTFYCPVLTATGEFGD
jgi:hypothetical protein